MNCFETWMRFAKQFAKSWQGTNKRMSWMVLFYYVLCPILRSANSNVNDGVNLQEDEEDLIVDDYQSDNENESVRHQYKTFIQRGLINLLILNLFLGISRILRRRKARLQFAGRLTEMQCLNSFYSSDNIAITIEK
jgi:hypothetical protein